MNSNNYKQSEHVLSLLLSILFGLIIVTLVSHFIDIGYVLQKTPSNSDASLYFRIVSWIAISLYTLNTLRMAHGFVISLYDERNPTSTGIPPYCPSEMFILLVTLLAPYISIQCLINFWKIEWFTLYNNIDKNYSFWLILCYMFPHIIYIIWDIKLHSSLKKKNDSDTNVKLYRKFVQLWLFTDFIVIFSILILLIVNGFKVNLSRTTLLIIFGLLHFSIFIFDYLVYNKRYYFPRFEIG